VSLTPAKPAIDLGIVTGDLDRLTHFYMEVVGLTDLGGGPTRSTEGGSVRNLACGDSVVKLIQYSDLPRAKAAPGPVNASTGYRYWTITVPDVPSIVAACVADGRTVVVPVKELSPGVRVAIVEDPDGNWIEFLDESD